MSYQELEARAGESVAKRLKDFFFADKPWSVPLACGIGVMLAALKRKAKAHMGEEDVIKVLRILESFGKDDYQEVLDYDQKIANWS